jgi:hypothetical protein
MGKYDALHDDAPTSSQPSKYAALHDDEPEAAPRAGVPGLDMGPTARRARAGGSPSRPRDLTAEEAGTMSGPLSFPGSTSIGAPEPSLFTPGGVQPESVARAYQAAESPAERAFRASPEGLAQKRLEEGEEAAGVLTFPLVLGAGRAVGAAAGGVAGAILPKAVARAAPVIGAAVEGGTVNKALGGDFGPGAALGALVPAATTAVDVVGRAASKGAPARVQKRIETNLGENVKHKTADKVTAVAKKGDLAEVVDRNPELRKSLAVQAAENPAAALKDVQKTKAKAMAQRDADFEKMQDYHADKPPSSQATVAGILDEYDALLAKNPGDVDRKAILKRARKQVTEMGDDLRKAQGLPPAVEGDYSGTVVSPKDLRDFEASIGRQAYEMGTPTSTKRKVNADLYRPIAKQVHALAEATPGVDAKRFAATGKDIHVLIPVEEALAYKADKLQQGKKPFMERMGNLAHGASTVAGVAGGAAAHGTTGAIVGLVAPTVARAAGKAAARAGRKIDFRLAEGAGKPRLSDPLAAPVQPLPLAAEKDKGRAYAGRVAAGMAAGLTLKDAVARADEGPGVPIDPGNIDLKNRPRVKNADGSISTVRSMGVNVDGQEVLIPTVSEDGRIMTDDEAVAQYKRTGRHLGKFRTPEDSTAYAERLHNDQAKLIGER